MNEDGKDICYRARPSWLNYVCLYICGVLLLLSGSAYGDLGVSLISCLLFAGLAAFLRFRHEFFIAGDRIIFREGLIARNASEMKIRHIRSLLVRQNIIERILAVGTVIAISAADGISEIVFKGIRDPYRLKEMLNKMM